MACVRVTGSADEIELFARSLGMIPKLHRRRDGMIAGYFEVQALKVVCLDLGTTGPNPVEDEIVAIAIVDWAGNVLHEGKYRPSRGGCGRRHLRSTGWPPTTRQTYPPFSTTR